MKLFFGSALFRALSAAALLLAGARLSADSTTFQLFPATLPSNPLLYPDPPDENALTLLDGVGLIDPPGSDSGPRLNFRFANQPILLGSAPDGPERPPVVNLRPAPSGFPRNLRTITTALIMATTIGYQAANSVKESSVGQPAFHFTNEGFFGKNTYTGGVDKASHFVDYTIAQRALATTYARIGYTSTQAAWLGFGTAFAAGITNEIGDGTTYYGFSYEDLTMDLLGSGTATILALYHWDDTFGFRFGPVNQGESPACCLDFSNIGRDYSGEIYTADVKIAGLARRLHFDPGPARFLLFSLTYGTNGYNTGSPAIRQRLVGLEIGIHFSEILRALGVPSEPVWGEVLYYFFDTFRIPYTSIGVRYDLNHYAWYGPTAGKTPFRVPAGAR